MRSTACMFYQSQARDFHLFSPEHIIALLVIATLALGILAFRDKLRSMSKQQRRKLEIAAGIALLLARSGMYLYYFNFQIGAKEFLPLYACRLVIIAILYTLFTGRRNLLFFIYYFGIIFGVLPLIVVDTSGYTFPHVMFFSFFFGHGMILLANIYFLEIYQYRPGKNDFHMAVVALILYFGVAAMANFLLQGNYNYLEAAPASLNLGDFSGTLPYKILLFSVFLLLFFLEYLPFSREKEEEEELPLHFK